MSLESLNDAVKIIEIFLVNALEHFFLYRYSYLAISDLKFVFHAEFGHLLFSLQTYFLNLRYLKIYLYLNQMILLI